ncbi:uncharacterized protein VSU04_017248 [Chlamydotis macqueenii]
MAWGTLGVLVVLAVKPTQLVFAPPSSFVTSKRESPPDATSPFQYDWHRLRVAGLVVAAVLCVIGIIVLISGKCKCGAKPGGTGHGDTGGHEDVGTSGTRGVGTWRVAEDMGTGDIERHSPP